MGDTNIKVVVRCRPLNSREIARGAKGLIKMLGNQTILSPPSAEELAATGKGDANTGGGTGTGGGASGRATEKKPQVFTFDKSYWSAGPREEPGYCSQQTLYEDLGSELLDHAFNGFNACILAYGQTGSGKSYSMMGYGSDKGIIPLTCEELFRRLDEKRDADPNIDFRVEVSYIEIYNEKVRDLLNPKNSGNLKVREHPSLGPYVEDLSKLVVGTYDEMITLMDEGNKARTVAATNMNETSSRSHSVFTLLLTMKRHDTATNLDTEKVSRINLIDLAGSERANSTGATGQRLKEGANINKSLTTLGKVISALATASLAAEASKGRGGGKKKAEEFVPYRDSVLTWLLKDSLGGNSKTAMIAAISPADYEETLSTLRYADQAKKIKNKAVVNEDPNAKLVRELKEELEMLRARVAGGGGIGGIGGVESTYDPSVPPEKQVVTYRAKDGTVKTVTKAELQEQLESSEKLMQSLNETWEEKMLKTQEVHKEREKALEELGITVEKNMVGVHAPKKMPHLVNLNEDPLMSECLVYQLKYGRTILGRLDSNKPAAIRLSGENILEEHCYIDNENGVVTLQAPADSITFLNGKRVAPNVPHKLKSGFRIILGEHHVFRFNHPEEVRKQRDRQKHLSIGGNGDFESERSSQASPATRPDSPASSAADADWNFAKREAALRLAGLDPDSMPDDQLDSLYEKITKVKTLRGKRFEGGSRPDSSLSLSQMDDMWSEMGRPIHSSEALTDDTSVDHQNGDEPVSAALASAQIREMQGQLEAQRVEFENRLQEIGEGSGGGGEAEDLKVEKEHMEKQLVVVQAQMKRLLEMRGRGRIDEDFVPFEPMLYSARQLRLIRKVLDKWRAHRAFSMAETVLSSAVTVKEANIISKELGKNVAYNFTVASGGSLAAPVSALDTIAGLDEFGDVADPVLASATQPSVGVKVLDRVNKAIYVWSLDRLQQQLQKMRNLTSFIDRPQYSQHFSSAQPFYDSPSPEYSFIGNALISLAPLSRRLSSTSTVPIFCRYTAEAIGSCRVDIKIASVTAPLKSRSGSAVSTRASSPIVQNLQPGCKVNFFLSVDQVKGLGSNDFSSVHLQIRLASLAGPSLKTQDVYPSATVDLTSVGSSELKFKRTFQLVVTPKVLAHMREGYAPIEFFASLQPTYLERMERWDEMREQRNIIPKPNASRTASASNSNPNLPAMRRSENDFVVEQVHDVVAWLTICELGADGKYNPVPVLSQSPLDPGSFSLRQGLQRRLRLTLSSNSGKQLPWVAVTKLRVGNVRLLDPKGRAHESESKDMVDIKLGKQQTVEFKPDGTGRLSIEAPWDSSMHDSALLNRVTATGQRILLQVSWSVDIDTCLDPVVFSMDMALAIQARDAGTPSRFASMFSSTKRLTKTSAIFSLKLTPPLTRSAKDLWRLDTSEKYVRGEEALGTWKPRGVSVVEDYERLVATEKRSADVQAIKVILASSPPHPYSGGRQPDDILKEALGLWQKRFGHRGQIVLSQEPDEEVTIPTLAPEPAIPLKLVAQAKLMPRSDMSTKSGFLLLLTDAGENSWQKLWFVLRRPHLYMYSYSNELEEVGVISLTGVKVEPSVAMVALLGKPHIFTLFTSSNSHVFAAPNEKELHTWISKLDPTRIPSP